MANPDMTGDNPPTFTVIILYKIQHSFLSVWGSYSSLTFMCVQDKGSAAAQSQAQEWKKGVAGNLPPELTWILAHCDIDGNEHADLTFLLRKDSLWFKNQQGFQPLPI
ncbi:hypothetical protein TNCV_480831 [Trichonephila clavipes]|nr:hypothetical protein TNCV_480831 [Trichonephila clavipes]